MNTRNPTKATEVYHLITSVRYNVRFSRKWRDY